MVANPVATSVETASAPSTADAPKTKVDRAARAIRILVDTLCVALFLYCQFSGLDVVEGIIKFWMVSVVAFPYARMAERVRASRESYWGFLVFGLLGLVILGFGLLRDVGPIHRLFHGTPTNDSMLLGVVFVLVGLTNVIRPHSIGRLLLGTATLVAGAILVW
jgi:hypothetical protein